jgi:hypothetical protein
MSAKEIEYRPPSAAMVDPHTPDPAEVTLPSVYVIRESQGRATIEAHANPAKGLQREHPSSDAAFTHLDTLHPSKDGWTKSSVRDID